MKNRLSESFEKTKGRKVSKPFAPSITSVRQHSMPGDANMVAWKSVMPVSSDLWKMKTAD